MINPSIITASSNFPGFQNYTIVTMTGTIAGGVLSAGGFTSGTISHALNNTNAISQVQVQYGNVNSNYFVDEGMIVYNPSTSYQIESFAYYKSGNVNLFTVVSNQTGGNVTIPTINITARVFLFLAPF